MRKSKVFPFLIVAIVATFLGLVIGLFVPFYKSRSTSTYFYDGRGHTSKGDWSYYFIAEVNPVLMAFIIISSILLIATLIVCLVTLNKASSKAPGGIVVIATTITFIVGFSAFISQFTLSNSSTSGMAGAWHSSGESVELSSGVAYIIFIIVAQITAVLGGLNYMRYIDEGGYVPSSSNYSSYTNSGVAVAENLTKKTITFPSSCTDGIRYTVDLFNDYLLIKSDYTGIETSSTYKTKYEDIQNTDLLVGDENVFLTINSSSIAYQIDSGNVSSIRSVIISIKNINNGTFSSKEALTNLDKEIRDKRDKIKAIKTESTSVSNTENEILKKANSFLEDFKKTYKVDFETFKCSFDNTTCQTEMRHTMGQECLIYLNKNKKLFFIARKDEYNPTIKLLITPKASYSGDEYQKALCTASVQAFRNVLFDYTDIVDIRFVNDKESISINTRRPPSGLKLALEAEFIHPMYAVGDALQGTKPITTDFDFSKYELIFEKNQFKHIYINKSVFESTDELKNIAHDMQVRRAKALEQRPAPAPIAAQSKTKMERLKELKELLDNNLITQEEYDSARADILKD